MAKSLEEIREILGDFENRISFLENSLLGSAMTAKEEAQEVKPIPEKPWMEKQWYRVEQVLGEMANLKRKFLELENEVRGRGEKYVYH